MPSYYGTRNLIELKVGTKHSIQILLHLRPCDVSWFNGTGSEMDADVGTEAGANMNMTVDMHRMMSETHYSELTSLISREILPIECKEYIEAIQQGAGKGKGKGSSGSSGSNSNIKQKKAPVASSKRKKSDASTTRTTQSSSKKKKQQQSITSTMISTGATHGGKKSHARTRTRGTKGKSSRIHEIVKDETKATTTTTTTRSKNTSYIQSLNVKFLFDDHIQIAYKVKSVRTNHRATLSFVSTMNTTSTDSNENEDENNTTRSTKNAEQDHQGYKTLSKFEYLQPIPKLIEIWCYPFHGDPKEITMDDVDGGFLRPEFIPISSLFKEHS